MLTIVWVRNGVATEGNHLMATLLNIGDAPFLMVKIAVGALAALVVIRWAELPVARYGLATALSCYVLLMGVHFLTGLSAIGMMFGISPESLVNLVSN